MSQWKKKLCSNEDGTCTASVEYKGTVFGLGTHNTMTDASKAVDAWAEERLTVKNKGKAA